MAMSIDERRARARAYAARKRREQGMPALGSAESKANRSAARKLKGEDHPNWKGDSVSYVALHAWVYRHKRRTGTCERCGTQPHPFRDGRPATQWANLSGQYRRDLADYAELCLRCHNEQDGRVIHHGTSTGYSHHKCRCDACRAAHADRSRRYKRNRSAT